MRTREGHIRAEMQKRIDAIAILKGEIDWLLKDQQVKIVSKYNGQPYGRSRRPLTGEIHRIESTYLDEFQGPRITVFLKRYRVRLHMDEIEFKDEGETPHG